MARLTHVTNTATMRTAITNARRKALSGDRMSVSANVLLVDDDPDLCRLLAAWLSERGMHVRWTTTAAAALPLLAAGDVDVLVADVCMDGMSGLELCDQVVTNHPDIPVLMLTAYGNREAAVSAIRVGALDFLTKPPAPDTSMPIR